MFNLKENNNMTDFGVCTDVQAPAYSVAPGDKTFRVSEDISFLIDDGLKVTLTAKFSNNLKQNEDLYLVSGIFSTEVELPVDLTTGAIFRPRLLFTRDGIHTYQVEPKYP